MGLFLPYKKMWDMPLGGVSQDRQIPHWFGNLAWVVVGGVCKLLFRYRVDGRDNLRAFDGKCGVVVVCNHTSFLDVAFVYLAARPKQWVRLIGRESLFEAGHGLLGQALSRVGAFPIKRDTSDRTAIKRAARDLKNKELVGIFPEGTRRGKSGTEPKLHSGAAFIAKMGGGAPLLPMTVRGAELVKQKGKFIRLPKITVEYGSPVLLSDFDDLPKHERLEACTWYVMRACFALSRNVPPDEVDMASLFPDAHDYTEYFRAHPVCVHTSEEVASAMAAAAKEKRA